ncbi:hypothetical protein [Litoreibacter halocynthiae]|uniref:hypothetical protein n=1 Tax=Litoreibacter halocynthiae TaxID=1242689 RepID=UPI002491B264|nr:hypothetical protein [Litoreibacter halocynthiae]
MKGSHSRLSFREAHRYSNIAHVQGAMITDADLTEAAQIHQDRDEAQGAAFAGSGVPAVGGMVALGKEDEVMLQSGTVFAQGKQGHFRLGDVEKEGVDLFSAFAAQADLPNGPPPTKGLVYVDLWERPIMAHEDPYLADAGLHGAETSYRTRTMVQLKCLPELGSLEDLPKALDQHPAFKARGTAVMSLELAQASTELDACDPCADLISIDKVLPNALVRIEVVSVERDKRGEMTAIRLAWSSENAEAVEPLETRSALERDNAVYEYFSETTEAQLGYFASDHVAARGAFTTDLRSDTPSDATLPKDTPELGYTHVRRWDGMVRLPLDTSTRPSGPSAASAKPRVSTRDITLTTEFFTLTLTHQRREMVAGDYWLAELRRYAPEYAQALLNGAPLGRAQPPLGPMHHFCPIAFSNGETLEPLPDALRRRLSFPTLTDLPASHISYDADPNCDLLGETQTVQEALDRVCEIDATHVAFTPSDEECETLGSARSVDEALNALCRADDNKQLQLMMRTMMDWGVVCGLSVELVDGTIEISGGVALDRNGILHERQRDQLRLSTFDESQFLPDAKSFVELQKRNVEICLSLGVRDGRTKYFLSPAALAYRTSDLTLSDQVQNCLEGRGSLTQSELFEKLPDQKDAVEVLTLLHVCLRNNIRPLPGAELNKSTINVAQKILDELIEEYQKRLSVAGDPLAKRKAEELREINAALDKELSNGPLQGTSGQLALVSKTLAYAAIMKKDEEFRLECLCDRVVPACPEQVEGWTLIPLACVELSNYKPGSIVASEVCMMCCRKQANTPRSQRYYNGDLIGTILSGFKDLCTEEVLRADNGPSGRLRAWLAAAGPAPWDPPQKTPLWPIKPTYGATNYQIGGPFLGGGGGAAVLNEWQRGFNPPILNVTGMKNDEAMKELKEAGFELAEKLDIGNVAQLVEMADGRRPLLNRRPGPGDRVVLLEREGVAVEFVVIEQAPPLFKNRFAEFGGLLKGDTGKLADKLKGDLGKLSQDQDRPILDIGEKGGKLTDVKGGKKQPAKSTKDLPKGRDLDVTDIKEVDKKKVIEKEPASIKKAPDKVLKGKLDILAQNPSRLKLETKTPTTKDEAPAKEKTVKTPTQPKRQTTTTRKGIGTRKPRGVTRKPRQPKK